MQSHHQHDLPISVSAVDLATISLGSAKYLPEDSPLRTRCAAADGTHQTPSSVKALSVTELGAPMAASGSPCETSPPLSESKKAASLDALDLCHLKDARSNLFALTDDPLSSEAGGGGGNATTPHLGGVAVGGGASSGGGEGGDDNNTNSVTPTRSRGVSTIVPTAIDVDDSTPQARHALLVALKNDVRMAAAQRARLLQQRARKERLAKAARRRSAVLNRLHSEREESQRKAAERATEKLERAYSARKAHLQERLERIAKIRPACWSAMSTTKRHSASSPHSSDEGSAEGSDVDEEKHNGKTTEPSAAEENALTVVVGAQLTKDHQAPVISSLTFAEPLSMANPLLEGGVSPSSQIDRLVLADLDARAFAQATQPPLLTQAPSSGNDASDFPSPCTASSSTTQILLDRHHGELRHLVKSLRASCHRLSALLPFADAAMTTQLQLASSTEEDVKTGVAAARQFLTSVTLEELQSLLMTDPFDACAHCADAHPKKRQCSAVRAHHQHGNHHHHHTQQLPAAAAHLLASVFNLRDLVRDDPDLAGCCPREIAMATPTPSAMKDAARTLLLAHYSAIEGLISSSPASAASVVASSEFSLVRKLAGFVRAVEAAAPAAAQQHTAHNGGGHGGVGSLPSEQDLTLIFAKLYDLAAAWLKCFSGASAQRVQQKEELQETIASTYVSMRCAQIDRDAEIDAKERKLREAFGDSSTGDGGDEEGDVDAATASSSREQARASRVKGRHVLLQQRRRALGSAIQSEITKLRRQLVSLGGHAALEKANAEIKRRTKCRNRNDEKQQDE